LVLLPAAGKGSRRIHTDNARLNWIVFWMQNFPGKGNTIQTNGHHLRNWWDVPANWDYIVSSSKSLGRRDHRHLDQRGRRNSGDALGR
jgi:hypothetical protein